MKKLTKTIASLAMVFMLAGCHGVKKVEYKEFAAEVAEAVKDADAPKISDTKYSGKLNGEKFSFKTSEINTLTDLDKVATIALINAAGTAGLAYVDGAKYYINMGFRMSHKTDDTKTEVEFDKYARLVKGVYELKDTKLSFSISYIK